MARKYFKSKEQKQAELNKASQMLVNGIKNYVNSDKYKELLENLSKFHKYSLNNTVLMVSQNPNISYVASYDDWKNKFNRQVKKGSHGLMIYVPIKNKVWEKVPKIDENGHIQYDEAGDKLTEWRQVTKLSFKIGYVFDLSQVEQIEGKPVVPLEYCRNLKGDVKEYDEILSALKEVSPVPIRFVKLDDGVRGYYSIKNKEIVVDNSLSQVHMIKTLLHEMAHAKLHDEPNFKNQIKFCVGIVGEKSSREMKLDEAINEYNAIEGKRKFIHFKIADGSPFTSYFPLILDGKLQTEKINKIEHFQKSEDVQRLIAEMQKYFFNKDQLRSVQEIQAESIAFIVCNHLGIDTDDYSFPYVTSWKQGKGMDVNDIEKELNVIKKTASSMIDKIDKNLDQLMLKPRLTFEIVDSEIHGIKEQNMSFAVANQVLNQFNNQYIANRQFLKGLVTDEFNNTNNVYRTNFKIEVIQTNKEPLTYNGCYYAGIEKGDVYHMINDYIKSTISQNSSINEEFETVFLPALKEANVSTDEDLQLAQEIFEENIYASDEEELERVDDGLEL